MGVDLIDLGRCREAAASGVLLTQQGPREALAHESTTVEAQAYHLMKALDEARAAIAQNTIESLAFRSSFSSPRLVEHLRHHSEGNYFAPLAKKIGVVVVAMGLIGTPAYLLFDTVGITYVGGLLGFYLFYEVLHRLEHTHGATTYYGRWARRHHFHHHFHNPKMNHGVTSPLWDLIFRTYQRPAAVIQVPERLQMPWLALPGADKVHQQWASDYAIRLAKRSA